MIIKIKVTLKEHHYSIFIVSIYYSKKQSNHHLQIQIQIQIPKS